MTITESGRGYEVHFDYRPAIVRDLKAIPGVRFQGKERGWFIPLIFKKKNEDGTEIQIHNRPQVEQFKKKHVVNAAGFDAKEQIFKINTLPELTIDIPWRKGVTPYPYQGNGIARGLELKRFINADQPGLGKTIQAIGTILGFHIMGENPFPCLVICPSTLKENWRREIEEKFSNRRAIILDSNNKQNWHSMVRMNMADFIITNYESLWSFFIIGTTVKGNNKPTLKEMLFDARKDLFKSVIIDELHKCFVYETPVLTNKGWMRIGFICENKIPDLHVLSCNLSTNVVSLKKITNYWINDLQDRKIYKITTSIGIIYCTGNHRIYTINGQKEALHLLPGETLLAVRGGFYGHTKGEEDANLLLSKVHNGSCAEITGVQSKIKGGGIPRARYRQSLRPLWKRVSCGRKWNSQKSNSFLFAKLLSKMAYVIAGNKSTSCNAGAEGKGTAISYNTNGQTRKKEITFRSHENKQSDVRPRMPGQGYRQITRQNIFEPRGKRAANGTSKNALRGIGIARRKYGMGYKDSAGLSAIFVPAIPLQGRYCNPGNNVGDRSGRVKSRDKKVEVFRQTQNGNLECIRVESCEIYQPGSIGDIGYSSVKNQRVYDIEVADNHNYFANGILVSNCKDATTRQAKVLKGLTTGKEIIIGLTGTPVVNKPKDLLSQLAIINQLHMFGGWKYFNDRYCQGGTGAAFLNELNGKLNNICFFRREKKDVLKDLPDKVREIITCDITTRAEYNQAKNDLGAFLKNQGYSEKQVNKSLNAEIMVKIGVLKSISARGKLPEAIEHIQEIVDAGEKIVVFIHQKFMANALMAAFPGSVCVRGTEIDESTGKEKAQSVASRQAAQDAFQACAVCKVRQDNHDSVMDHEYEPNNVNVIICSIKAAGVGITLTASSRLIFLELPWHPADVEQCEDRIHRIGQKNAAQISYFLGKNTIDEDIYKIIESKRDVSDAITGTTTTIDTIITDLTRSLFNQR